MTNEDGHRIADALEKISVLLESFVGLVSDIEFFVDNKNTPQEYLAALKDMTVIDDD